MIDLLETIFIWGLYLGLPVVLLLYIFDLKEIIIYFGLIFTVYTILPLPDDESFPSSSNFEPITVVIADKELCNEFRGGGQKSSVPFLRRILALFVPKSSGSSNQQCPKPAAQNMKFPYGPSSDNGGSGNDKGARSQAVPDREQWDSDPESYRYDKNQEKKKKKDEEQCLETPVIVSEDGLKSVTAVKNTAKKSFKNNDVKNEYSRFKKRLEAGIHPLDINKKSTGRGKNIYLLKGSEGRYVVEYLATDDVRVVNILGVADRNNQATLDSLEKAMLTNYGIVINY